MAKTKELQERVAETMLQVPTTITIGEREYAIAPPSFGTLELVSAMLSRIPDIGDLRDEPTDVKAKVLLQKARDFGVLPEMLAVLILGSKHIGDTERVAEKRRKRGIRGFFGAKEVEYREVKTAERLAREIRDNVSPAQMAEVVPFLIGSLQLTDFFVLTTFLREISVTEPTKVEKKTTAPGRSSRASSKVTT